VKAGLAVGPTDEIGEKAVEVAHPLKNVHTTILHLKLVSRFQRRWICGAVGGQKRTNEFSPTPYPVLKIWY
jgi:hypothetical protein